MDCKEAREILDEAIDGRLEPLRAADLERHLCACGPCAAEKEERLRVGKILRAWAAERVEDAAPRLDAMWTRVRARIEEGERARAASGWLRRWFWLPAAAVLAAATLLFYPSNVSRAPFHPRSFDVSVESLESDTATVALVDRGADLPRVIWIVEDGKT